MIKIERKSFKYFFIALLFQYILFFLFSDELTLRRTELFVFFFSKCVIKFLYY